MPHIYIHGVEVPVSLMDGDLLDMRGKGDGIGGLADLEMGILIRAGMYPGEQVTTLLHEAGHIALGPEEGAALSWERFIMCLLRENGADLSWAERIIAEAQREYDAANQDDADEA